MLSGQGDQRKRALLGVKLCGRIVMWTAVAKVEGQGGLTVGSAAQFYPGRDAAQRTAPVSADRETRQYHAATAPDNYPLIFDLDRRGFVLDARQCCKRLRARFKPYGE